MTTKCLNCNVPFEPGRADQMFCGDICGAAYWKVHGTTHNHKDLPHFNCKNCLHCEQQFWYNDYAERKGQRVPKFCSTKCRVAHHRQEQKAQVPPPPRYAPPPPRDEPIFKTGDFRDALRPPSRWTAELAFKWLGVPYDASKSQCAGVFRLLNKRYHPDVNQNKSWPHLVHVNAAYDYLKRHYWN